MAIASAPTSALGGPRYTLPPDEVVFGSSPTMLAVQQRLMKVAGANIPILITGESGTGKEIITRMIHQLSPWGNGPFVKVNCPAIPGTLIESELFGYERGAFTGAFGTKAGRMEMANRGTLFLDEIGELDMDLQAKLLQVLQDGQFCRIGSQEDKRLETRVVCATNRSLEEEVERGAFRQDLYYRINVVNILLPPLRERRADIPAIVNYFVQLYNGQFHRAAEPLPAALLQQMQQFAWPGNVRQLENVIKRYVILGSTEVINSRGKPCGRSSATSF
jgi:two-component system response regulator AtoC